MNWVHPRRYALEATGKDPKQVARLSSLFAKRWTIFWKDTEAELETFLTQLRKSNKGEDWKEWTQLDLNQQPQDYEDLSGGISKF